MFLIHNFTLSYVVLSVVSFRIRKGHKDGLLKISAISKVVAINIKLEKACRLSFSIGASVESTVSSLLVLIFMQSFKTCYVFPGVYKAYNRFSFVVYCSCVSTRQNILTSGQFLAMGCVTT